MKIMLTQEDIEQAIQNYIYDAGVHFSVTNINFTATRNPVGMTAEIDLNAGESEEDETPRKSKAAKKAKAKQKESTPVATSDDTPDEEATDSGFVDPVEEASIEPEMPPPSNAVPASTGESIFA